MNRFAVDLWNPGQVLACLGFLEASEVLAGPSQGRFCWLDQSQAFFELECEKVGNPLEVVFEFLSQARVKSVEPVGYQEDKSAGDSDEEIGTEDRIVGSETFPCAKGDKMALPVCLDGIITVELSHWTDGARDENFKLYAGNRSAYGIARSMIFGIHKPPAKGKQIGVILKEGVVQLWQSRRSQLLSDPLGVLTPVGGTFNFDARAAWTAIDAGYSPNDQGQSVRGSPVVEIFSAWGLQFTRPRPTSRTRYYGYSVWSQFLPPQLSRVAFWGGLGDFDQRRFEFQLALAGKNKVMNYAKEI